MAKNQVEHVRTDNDWFQIITTCRNSGLTDAQWCEVNGISISSLRAAARRLKDRSFVIPEHPKPAQRIFDLTAQTPDVVKVDIVPETKKEHTGITQITENIHDYSLELSNGNMTVKIRNCIDSDLLSKVFDLVQGE